MPGLTKGAYVNTSRIRLIENSLSYVAEWGRLFGGNRE